MVLARYEGMSPCVLSICDPNYDNLLQLRISPLHLQIFGTVPGIRCLFEPYTLPGALSGTNWWNPGINFPWTRRLERKRINLSSMYHKAEIYLIIYANHHWA